VIGLILLALNFEKTVRDWIGGRSREYALAGYVDLKFFIAREMATACAHEKENEEAKLTCFDIKNIDNGISPLHVRHWQPYLLIENWQKNPHIEGIIDGTNRYLHRINSALPSAASALSFVSDPGKTDILILSMILVVVSLAGSIGEAAFQYQLAVKAAEDERSKEAPKSI
jgi:hypothetical protein